MNGTCLLPNVTKAYIYLQSGRKATCLSIMLLIFLEREIILLLLFYYQFHNGAENLTSSSLSSIATENVDTSISIKVPTRTFCVYL